MSDTVGLGDLEIENVTLAVVTDLTYWPSLEPGVMGIGLDTGEVATESGAAPHPGLLDHMVDQGLINTRTYSLWLDALSESNIIP